MSTAKKISTITLIVVHVSIPSSGGVWNEMYNGVLKQVNIKRLVTNMSHRYLPGSSGYSRYHFLCCLSFILSCFSRSLSIRSEFYCSFSSIWFKTEGCTWLDFWSEDARFGVPNLLSVGWLSAYEAIWSCLMCWRFSATLSLNHSARMLFSLSFWFVYEVNLRVF